VALLPLDRETGIDGGCSGPASGRGPPLSESDASSANRSRTA
jgi:hypothetical protein